MAVLGSWSLVAVAQPDREAIAIEWKASEGCISYQTLIDRLRADGVDIRQDAAAGPTVSGRIGPVQGGWQVRFSYRTDKGVVTGSRAFVSDADDCRSADDQIVLVLQLLLDQPESLDPLENLPSPKHVVGTQKAPTKIAKAARTANPSVDEPKPKKTESTHRVGVGVGLETTIGRLPGFGAGVGLWGTWMLDWLGLEIDAAYFPHASVENSVGAGSFSMLSVGAAACARPMTSGAFGFGICFGVQTGFIRGQGSGFDHVSARTRPHLSLVLRGQVLWTFASHLMFYFRPGLNVPLARERFFYQDSAGVSVTVFRADAIAASFNLGLALNW